MSLSRQQTFERNCRTEAITTTIFFPLTETTCIRSFFAKFSDSYQIPIGWKCLIYVWGIFFLSLPLKKLVIPWIKSFIFLIIFQIFWRSNYHEIMMLEIIIIFSVSVVVHWPSSKFPKSFYHWRHGGNTFWTCPVLWSPI